MRSHCWRITALTALSVAVVGRVMPAASQPPPTAARARTPSTRAITAATSMWHRGSPANAAATSMFLGLPDHEHRCGMDVRGESTAYFAGCALRAGQLGEGGGGAGGGGRRGALVDRDD